jgi:hypothetical protein
MNYNMKFGLWIIGSLIGGIVCLGICARIIINWPGIISLPVYGACIIGPWIFLAKQLGIFDDKKGKE